MANVPFGPRPIFPTEPGKPEIALPEQPNIVLIDGLLHCSEHKKQVCAECSIDYSTQNFLTKQLSANRGALPPPNPQMAQVIQKLKTEGNGMFRNQSHYEAAQKYTEAINIASQRPLWDPSQIIIEESAVLHCNRAACLLDLDHPSEAYWDTEVVTRLRRGWSKGHFRMGRSLMGMGRCQQAAQSFQIGCSLDADAKEMKTALEDARKYV